MSQFGAAVAGEVDAATAPALKQNLGNKTLMIDVHTPAEIEYVGIANSVDANFPYMMDDYGAWYDKKSRFMMSTNSGFLSRVSDIETQSGLNKSDTVIVLCRSGDRSARAADLLSKAGYTNVYSVVDGFEGNMAKDGDNKDRRAANGWKNAGLPWSYNLVKNKMYVE